MALKRISYGQVEIDGWPVTGHEVVSDIDGLRGSFTAPRKATFRPGHMIGVEGFGNTVVGQVHRISVTPDAMHVEWHALTPELTASAIIDRAARELARRHPA